jgi:hypothetical protein
MAVNYEPPLSEQPPGLKAWCAGVLPLAPGVFGYAYMEGEEIWIPLIMAEKKGAGDVGRFLDNLSPRCVIVDVTSKRLEAMLIRRGWKKRLGTEHDTWRRLDNVVKVPASLNSATL